ncbi:hypothetical protein ACJZ2D_014126 [Fusarium nematophilum]
MVRSDIGREELAIVGTFIANPSTSSRGLAHMKRRGARERAPRFAESVLKMRFRVTLDMSAVSAAVVSYGSGKEAQDCYIRSMVDFALYADADPKVSVEGQINNLSFEPISFSRRAGKPAREVVCKTDSSAT